MQNQAKKEDEQSNQGTKRLARIVKTHQIIKTGIIDKVRKSRELKLEELKGLHANSSNDILGVRSQHNSSSNQGSNQRGAFRHKDSQDTLAPNSISMKNKGNKKQKARKKSDESDDQKKKDLSSVGGEGANAEDEGLMNSHNKGQMKEKKKNKKQKGKSKKEKGGIDGEEHARGEDECKDNGEGGVEGDGNGDSVDGDGEKKSSDSEEESSDESVDNLSSRNKSSAKISSLPDDSSNSVSQSRQSSSVEGKKKQEKQKQKNNKKRKSSAASPGKFGSSSALNQEALRSSLIRQQQQQLKQPEIKVKIEYSDTDNEQTEHLSSSQKEDEASKAKEYVSKYLSKKDGLQQQNQNYHQLRLQTVTACKVMGKRGSYQQVIGVNGNSGVGMGLGNSGGITVSPSQQQQSTPIANLSKEGSPQTTAAPVTGAGTGTGQEVAQQQQEQILFLTSLSQNSSLNKNVFLTETMNDDKKIKINMKVNDFFSFLRLQHEISELQRMQKYYKEATDDMLQQKAHQDPLQQEKEMQRKRELYKINQKTQDYFMGINIAKKFLKKAKLKTTEKALNIASTFIRRQSIIAHPSPGIRTPQSNLIKTPVNKAVNNPNNSRAPQTKELSGFKQYMEAYQNGKEEGKDESNLNQEAEIEVERVDEDQKEQSDINEEDDKAAQISDSDDEDEGDGDLVKNQSASHRSSGSGGKGQLNRNVNLKFKEDQILQNSQKTELDEVIETQREHIQQNGPSQNSIESLKDIKQAKLKNNSTISLDNKKLQKKYQQKMSSSSDSQQENKDAEQQ